MENAREIVLFLIDANPIAWGTKNISFTEAISQLFSYLSQMILSDVFQLAPVLAYNQCGVSWLFPSPDEAPLLIKGSLQATNPAEILSYCKTIAQKLAEFSRKCTTIEQNRNDVRLDVAISTAICHLNRYPPDFLKRILVLTPSNDSKSNFESTMNSIYAAHRINITIDSILIDVSDSLFLNQAAIITNGFSITIKNRVQYLLQYLLSIPPLPIRNLIVLKEVKAENYTTPAVNTKDLINQGIMCPVCLSVFEQKNEKIRICEVCKSREQI